MKKFLDILRTFLWSFWGDIPQDTDEVIEEIMQKPLDDPDSVMEVQKHLMNFVSAVAIVLLMIAVVLYFSD